MKEETNVIGLTAQTARSGRKKEALFLAVLTAALLLADLYGLAIVREAGGSLRQAVCAMALCLLAFALSCILLCWKEAPLPLCFLVAELPIGLCYLLLLDTGSGRKLPKFLFFLLFTAVTFAAMLRRRDAAAFLFAVALLPTVIGSCFTPDASSVLLLLSLALCLLPGEVVAAIASAIAAVALAFLRYRRTFGAWPLRDLFHLPNKAEIYRADYHLFSLGADYLGVDERQIPQYLTLLLLLCLLPLLLRDEKNASSEDTERRFDDITIGPKGRILRSHQIQALQWGGYGPLTWITLGVCLCALLLLARLDLMGCPVRGTAYLPFLLPLALVLRPASLRLPPAAKRRVLLAAVWVSGAVGVALLVE